MSYDATEKGQIEKIFERKSWLKKAVDARNNVNEIKIRTGFRTDDGRFGKKGNCDRIPLSTTEWLSKSTISYPSTWTLHKVFFDKHGTVLFDTSAPKPTQKAGFFSTIGWTRETKVESTIDILRGLRSQGTEPYYLAIRETEFHCSSNNVQDIFLYQTPEKLGFISLIEYAEHIIWKESKEESEKLKKALNGDIENAPEIESLKKSLQDLIKRLDTGDSSLYQAREELKKLYEPPIVKEIKKIYQYNDCCGGH